MNIGRVIELECPRYAKKIIYSEQVQVIIDLHSMFPDSCPVKIAPLDEDIDEELEKMNRSYENHLRSVFNEF